MKDWLSIILFGIVGLAVLCALAYGWYWIFKTVSYQLFYEDMVKQTIAELVNHDCLKIK